VAIVTRVNFYFQRAAWLFFCVLHDRLHGDDCAGANVKRELVERRVKRDVLRAGVILRGPIVVPISWR
jgi:hypothetical protein